MINMEDHGGSRDSREGGIDVVINMWGGRNGGQYGGPRRKQGQ